MRVRQGGTVTRTAIALRLHNGGVIGGEETYEVCRTLVGLTPGLLSQVSLSMWRRGVSGYWRGGGQGLEIFARPNLFESLATMPGSYRASYA